MNLKPIGQFNIGQTHFSFFKAPQQENVINTSMISG
jgi:hypothetical protein